MFRLEKNNVHQHFIALISGNLTYVIISCFEYTCIYRKVLKGVSLIDNCVIRYETN